MSSPPSLESPTTSQSNDDILFRDLHALHADELAFLSQRLLIPSGRWQHSFTAHVLRMLKHYARFLRVTWTKAIWSLLFFPTTLWDRLSVIVLSVGATIIISILLVWCILCNVPIISRSFVRWSTRAAGGLSLVNAAYPTIFQELSADQVSAARHSLAQLISEAPCTSHKRVFNLDVAKLLLQCSSVMYERTSQPIQHALAVAASHRSRHPPRKMTDWDAITPGQHLTAICGNDGAERVMDHLHGNDQENTIQALAARLGLQYSTISELNSVGSAFCGLFWDPKSTYIIVAFKGTTPTEFVEWSIDFTFQPRDAGQWLRGFGKVHGGFIDKIFPRKIDPGSRLPYDTIKEAIKVVSIRLLIGRPPDTQINVWTTGHSLGCALASLVYARQVNESRDFGPNVVFRDAYLFAAPIVCDAESVNAFNNRMNHNSDRPRTMWRITNGNDAVATSLPDQGDSSEWNLSPYNLFTFAHLGTEIKMRTAPNPCIVKGNHITPGTHVVVQSAFHSDTLNLHETPLRKKMRWLEELPLIGRLLCHGTGFYWSQLQAVGTGTCEWEDDD